MTALLALVTFISFGHLEHAAPIHPVVSEAVVRVPTHDAGEPWSVRFPRGAQDYRIELVTPKGGEVVAQGHTVSLKGIPLPSVTAGRFIRLRATFVEDYPARIAPTAELDAKYWPDVVIITAFFGFFAAIAIINIVSSIVLRSIPSAWYSVVAGVSAMIMLYLTYTLPQLYGYNIFVDQSTHALLIAAYMGSVTAFAVSLLGTWKHDRIITIVAWLLFALNGCLVFAEDLLAGYWPYYAVDQFALDALLVVLVILGIRAWRRGSAPFSRSYLVAFIGPLAGVPIDDLAVHNIIGGDIARYSFEAGIAWEAVFFAYAVSLRNRALSSERDWFDKLAHADALTGVSNRRTFDEVLLSQWERSAKTRAALGLIILDIDHFKKYNDTYGHRQGDEILRDVAKACAAEIRSEGDCFARYGGEEFVAILPGASIDGVAAVAERMRAAVERVGTVTISAGTASIVPRSGGDPGLLVSAADAALYRAKEEGRNRVRCA